MFITHSSFFYLHFQVQRQNSGYNSLTHVALMSPYIRVIDIPGFPVSAAQESVEGYHFLFSLPPFVCFIKVFALHHNESRFILFLFILEAGGKMWWLMRG